MTKEELARKLKQLPEPVRDHLYDEVVGELNGIIIDHNDLNAAQRQALFDLIKEIIVGEVKIDFLESEVTKRFGFDKDRTRKLALDITGYRLLPLDKWLGDVSGLVRTFGGDPFAFPTDRVVVQEHTEKEAFDELIAEPTTTTLDVRLKERLRDIAHSFLNGVRTEAQVLEVLKKSVKTGGLELASGAALRVLENIKQEAKTVKPAEPSDPAPSNHQLPAVKPPKLDAPMPEDAAEARAGAESLLASKEARKADMTAEKIKASVERIYAAAGIVPPDERLQARMKDVIGSRLRDVRDALETLEILVQPKELGGLSLSEDDARKILKTVDDSLRAVHDEHKLQVEGKKVEWLEAEADKKLSADVAEQNKEATELDSLYQNIVAKSPKAQAKAPAPLPIVRQQVAEPVPINVPANLPIVGEPPSPQRAGDFSPVLPAPSVMPKPVTLVRPAAQIAASPSVRPIMQDVKDIGGGMDLRLTGPAEELRTTTIVDFRRLSKDPLVASHNIYDKIDLLHHQSYEKRTEAINAWMESEVYRTYLDMMKEAFEGKALPQVIAERGASKKLVLTVEEVSAVADLSQKLRY